MAIRVVGAGVGRTGTLSLKSALEQLTGEPCYHMIEVIGHPDHVPMWRAAAETGDVDWSKLLAGYGTTSDFPACLFWREILDTNPDAVVLLSTRQSSEAWWASAGQTIFAFGQGDLPPEMSEWFEMWMAVSTARFTGDWRDKDAAIAAYERHNADVRANAPADRLVEWQPGDGWKPLADALGVAAPDEPFPHLNKKEDFPLLTPDTEIDEALEQMRPK